MASLGRLLASIGAPGCRFGRRFGVSGRPFGVSGRALGVLGGHLGASGRPFGVCGSAWGGKFTDSDQVSQAKACIKEYRWISMSQATPARALFLATGVGGAVA